MQEFQIFNVVLERKVKALILVSIYHFTLVKQKMHKTFVYLHLTDQNQQ